MLNVCEGLTVLPPECTYSGAIGDEIIVAWNIAFPSVWERAAVEIFRRPLFNHCGDNAALIYSTKGVMLSVWSAVPNDLSLWHAPKGSSSSYSVVQLCQHPTNVMWIKADISLLAHLVGGVMEAFLIPAALFQ